MNTGRNLVESIMNASDGLIKLQTDADGVLTAEGVRKLSSMIGELMGYLYYDVYVLEILKKHPELKGLLENLESERNES
jgi:hypothetical protein